LPYGLFRREIGKLGHRLDDPDDLAVGVIFLPRADPAANAQGRALIERLLLAEGLTIFGWRTVPVRPEVLGDKGLATLPDIQHVLIGRRPGMRGDIFERTLYLVR